MDIWTRKRKSYEIIKKIIENEYVNRKRGNSVPRAHVGTMGIYSITPKITKT
jgi:hypothetical protein